MTSPTCTHLGPDYDPREWHKTNPGVPTPFCGCATLAGKSYCSEHYPVVYAVGTALRRRHKDLRVKNSIEDTLQMIIDINDELEAEGWEPSQGWEDSPEFQK